MCTIVILIEIEYLIFEQFVLLQFQSKKPLKKIRLVQKAFEVFGKKSVVNCVVKTKKIIEGTSIQIFENMSQLKMLEHHSKKIGFDRLPSEIQIDQQRSQPDTVGDVFTGFQQVGITGQRSFSMVKNGFLGEAETWKALRAVEELVTSKVPVAQLFSTLSLFSGFTYPWFWAHAIYVCPYTFTS